MGRRVGTTRFADGSIQIDRHPAHVFYLSNPPFSLTDAMSVLLQLKIFATIASLSGAILLIKPAILLKSPLDPIIVRWAGLPSSNADPAAVAPAGIAISAIGMIYWCAIWSGDDKLVLVSGTSA